MLIKVALLFLVVIAVLAIFGRLRFGESARRGRWPSCGRPLIGTGPCACKGQA